jgi:hypothetical protein
VEAYRTAHHVALAGDGGAAIGIRPRAIGGGRESRAGRALRDAL